MPATPTPAPGEMTVPPLFGWEQLAVVLLVLVVLVLAVSLVAAARAGRGNRAEFAAWLEARSTRDGTGRPG
ncbi:hypothetical protein [Trujillonella humicola]|uniref:hypothetical protein n=1 Tax=Trujillonella humicola TaxID=3383699 RepID=UPI0039067859